MRNDANTNTQLAQQNTITHTKQWNNKKQQHTQHNNEATMNWNNISYKHRTQEQWTQWWASIAKNNEDDIEQLQTMLLLQASINSKRHRTTTTNITKAIKQQ